MELTLAIESSCDETSAAVVSSDGKILSNSVASQAAEHALTSGVVPEQAARRHAENIVPTIEAALKEAKTTLPDIARIAVTSTPGLLSCLHVGVTAAKSLAVTLNKPLVPVNHLDAHIAITFVQDPKPVFPLVSLLVSGGHSELSRHTDEKTRTRLGGTRDDAAGEAFDKVAKLLGLPYPGGPQISKAAKNGNPHAFPFPRPMLHEQTDDFSFSGLKTDVARVIKTLPQPLSEQTKVDVAASFQAAMVETLVTKTVRAAERENAASVILAGGVAANTALRDTLATALEKVGIPLHVPPIALCGDNAAMIGIASLWKEPAEPETIHAVPTSRKRITHHS